MRGHIRRFGWLYITMIVLIAWPIVLYRAQRVPPLDPETLRRLAVAIQEDFAKQHPGLALRRFTQAEELKLPENRNQDYAGIMSVSDMGSAAAMPALASELTSITARYEARMKAWDELTSRGIVYFPMLREDGKGPQDIQEIQASVPSFLAIQTFCKVRRAQAERAIMEQRWPEALRLLESSAHFGDPLRYNGVIGNMIAVATRNIAYGGYAALLRAEPPAETAQAALAALIALRSSDPVFDKWTWLSEREYAIQHALFILTQKDDLRRKAPPGVEVLSLQAEMQMALMMSAGALAQQHDRIKDPALRKRAEAIANWAKSDTYFGSAGGIGMASMADRMKWTTAPALQKWFEQMVEKEPWVRETLIDRFLSLTPGAKSEELDPWTVLMISISSLNANFLEAATRGQVAETRGRMLEAGFAARIYKDRHGAWPKTMKDLGGIYAPPENKAPTSATLPSPAMWASIAEEAFLPLRLAEREMNEDLKGALWDAVLPLKGFNSQSDPGGIRPGGEYDCVESNAQSEWLKEPARLLAIEQALLAHPALVESAKALATRDEVTGWMNAEARKGYQWTALSDEFIRHADKTADKQGEAAPINAVRYKAKLRAPQKAMVVWSPGPDGMDDGGMIVYDPTNGTKSLGDLVAFPEKY